MTNEIDLEPLAPDTAKEMYHQEREGDVTERTLQAHHYRLVHFVRWCDQEDIDNLNDLTGRLLHEYRLWRKDDGDLNAVSLRTQLETLRVFIKFSETIDAVPSGLHEKILLPTLSNDDEQREEILETEQAEAVLDYLRRFEYASRNHVVLELLWHTGIRLGSLVALDLDDYDPDEHRLSLRHRPETDTCLKNGAEGERLVALNEDMCMAANSESNLRIRPATCCWRELKPEIEVVDPPEIPADSAGPESRIHGGIPEAPDSTLRSHRRLHLPPVEVGITNAVQTPYHPCGVPSDPLTTGPLTSESILRGERSYGLTLDDSKTRNLLPDEPGGIGSASRAGSPEAPVSQNQF